MKIKQKQDFEYESFNHAKTRLRYHIIFSTKFRRKCLNEIRDMVLDAFKYAKSISHFRILVMELDKDHIHFLVSFPPAYSIEQTVRRMKMISTNYVYERCENYLKKFYWKDKRLLWTHGYFCSTIGEVSEQKVKHDIENKG